MGPAGATAAARADCALSARRTASELVAAALAYPADAEPGAAAVAGALLREEAGARLRRLGAELDVTVRWDELVVSLAAPAATATRALRELPAALAVRPAPRALARAAARAASERAARVSDPGVVARLALARRTGVREIARDLGAAAAPPAWGATAVAAVLEQIADGARRAALCGGFDGAAEDAVGGSLAARPRPAAADAFHVGAEPAPTRDASAVAFAASASSPAAAEACVIALYGALHRLRAERADLYGIQTDAGGALVVGCVWCTPSARADVERGVLAAVGEVATLDARPRARAALQALARRRVLAQRSETYAAWLLDGVADVHVALERLSRTGAWAIPAPAEWAVG